MPESDWAKVVAPGWRLRAARKRGSRGRTNTSKRDVVPPLPDADDQGNRPALAFADATIARSIIQRRKGLGLSQVGLANLAGIRVEVLNRAERAVTLPSLRTLTKIEGVLSHVEGRSAASRR